MIAEIKVKVANFLDWHALHDMSAAAKSPITARRPKKINCAAKKPPRPWSPEIFAMVVIGLNVSGIFPKKSKGNAITSATIGVIIKVSSPRIIASSA